MKFSKTAVQVDTAATIIISKRELVDTAQSNLLHLLQCLRLHPRPLLYVMDRLKPGVNCKLNYRQLVTLVHGIKVQVWLLTTALLALYINQHQLHDLSQSQQPLL